MERHKSSNDHSSSSCSLQKHFGSSSEGQGCTVAMNTTAVPFELTSLVYQFCGMCARHLGVCLRFCYPVESGAPLEMCTGFMVFFFFFFKLHHTASAVFDCGSCNA